MRWIAGLMMVVAACTSTTESRRGDEGESDLAAVGCYSLALEAWDPPLDQALPALPGVVELKAELGTNVLEADRRLARPNPDDGIGVYAFSWWEPLRGDSVSMVWSTGFEGVALRLKREDQGLRGYAEPFFDRPGQQSKAKARMERVECWR